MSPALPFHIRGVFCKLASAWITQFIINCLNEQCVYFAYCACSQNYPMETLPIRLTVLCHCSTSFYMCISILYNLYCKEFWMLHIFAICMQHAYIASSMLNICTWVTCERTSKQIMGNLTFFSKGLRRING